MPHFIRVMLNSANPEVERVTFALKAVFDQTRPIFDQIDQNQNAIIRKTFASSLGIQFDDSKPADKTIQLPIPVLVAFMNQKKMRIDHEKMAFYHFEHDGKNIIQDKQINGVDANAFLQSFATIKPADLSAPAAASDPQTLSTPPSSPAPAGKKDSGSGSPGRKEKDALEAAKQSYTQKLEMLNNLRKQLTEEEKAANHVKDDELPTIADRENLTQLNAAVQSLNGLILALTDVMGQKEKAKRKEQEEAKRKEDEQHKAAEDKLRELEARKAELDSRRKELEREKAEAAEKKRQEEAAAQAAEAKRQEEAAAQAAEKKRQEEAAAQAAAEKKSAGSSAPSSADQLAALRAKYAANKEGFEQKCGQLTADEVVALKLAVLADPNTLDTPEKIATEAQKIDGNLKSLLAASQAKHAEALAIYKSDLLRYARAWDQVKHKDELRELKPLPTEEKAARLELKELRTTIALLRTQMDQILAQILKEQKAAYANAHAQYLEISAKVPEDKKGVVPTNICAPDLVYAMTTLDAVNKERLLLNTAAKMAMQHVKPDDRADAPLSSPSKTDTSANRPAPQGDLRPLPGSTPPAQQPLNWLQRRLAGFQELPTWARFVIGFTVAAVLVAGLLAATWGTLGFAAPSVAVAVLTTLHLASAGFSIPVALAGGVLAGGAVATAAGGFLTGAAVYSAVEREELLDRSHPTPAGHQASGQLPPAAGAQKKLAGKTEAIGGPDSTKLDAEQSNFAFLFNCGGNSAPTAGTGTGTRPAQQPPGIEAH